MLPLMTRSRHCRGTGVHTHISAKLWATLGWISILLVASSIPFGMIGGVFLVFLLFVAIILGGLSGVGLKSTTKFGVTTIVLSFLIVYIVTHYAASTGLQSFQLKRMFSLLTFLALPIVIAAARLIVGVVRRRNTGDRGPEC